jgi:GTPase SAR1 family protein
MERDEYDDIYKSNSSLIPVIVVGDASVGKTNIIHCYSKGKIANNTMPTVGVEFTSRIVPLRTSTG